MIKEALHMDRDHHGQRVRDDVDRLCKVMIGNSTADGSRPRRDLDVAAVLAEHGTREVTASLTYTITTLITWLIRKRGGGCFEQVLEEFLDQLFPPHLAELRAMVRWQVRQGGQPSLSDPRAQIDYVHALLAVHCTLIIAVAGNGGERRS